MSGIVYRGVIQQNEVLVRSSSSNIYPCATLPCIAHARQQLNRFQEVNLSQKCGYRPDLFNGQGEFAHLCILYIGIPFF